MRLTIRALGTEVFHVDTDPDEDEKGDVTTNPVGFAPTPGDQRWERGADL